MQHATQRLFHVSFKLLLKKISVMQDVPENSHSIKYLECSITHLYR